MTHLVSTELNIVDVKKETELPKRLIKDDRKKLQNGDNYVISVKNDAGFTPAEGILHDENENVVGLSVAEEDGTVHIYQDKLFIKINSYREWINKCLNKDPASIDKLSRNCEDNEKQNRVLGNNPENNVAKASKRKNSENNQGTSKQVKKTCSFGFISSLFKWFA